MIDLVDSLFSCLQIFFDSLFFDIIRSHSVHFLLRAEHTYQNYKGEPTTTTPGFKPTYAASIYSMYQLLAIGSN